MLTSEVAAKLESMIGYLIMRGITCLFIGFVNKVAVCQLSYSIKKRKKKKTVCEVVLWFADVDRIMMRWCRWWRQSMPYPMSRSLALWPFSISMLLL